MTCRASRLRRSSGSEIHLPRRKKPALCGLFFVLTVGCPAPAEKLPEWRLHLQRPALVVHVLFVTVDPPCAACGARERADRDRARGGGLDALRVGDSQQSMAWRAALMEFDCGASRAECHADGSLKGHANWGVLAQRWGAGVGQRCSLSNYLLTRV